MPSVVFTPPLSDPVPAFGLSEPRPAMLSFPTRRSSDLLVPADWVSVTVTVQVRSWPTTAGSWQSTEVVVERVSTAMSSPSEAQTAELQSHHEHVSRLLLVPITYADGV